MKALLRLVAWLMLMAATQAGAGTPSTIHASYDIYKLGIKIGQIEETYQHVQDRYELVSTTRAVGFFSLFKSGKIIVRSSGLIDAQGLRPRSSSAVNESNPKDEKRAEFDWVARKISVTQHNKRSMLDLSDKTQDRLSAMYQFMFLPMTSPTLAFQMLNGNYLLNFHFDIAPGPELKTPAGKFSTLYLDNKEQGAKERTELWLATQYYNLPCKMIVTDAEGGRITQILSKLDVRP